MIAAVPSISLVTDTSFNCRGHIHYVLLGGAVRRSRAVLPLVSEISPVDSSMSGSGAGISGATSRTNLAFAMPHAAARQSSWHDAQDLYYSKDTGLGRILNALANFRAGRLAIQLLLLPSMF